MTGILENSEHMLNEVREAFNIFKEKHPEAASSPEYQELVTRTTLYFGDIRNDIEDMKKVAELGKIEDLIIEVTHMRGLIRIDDLTGLGNRRSYNEVLFKEADFAVRNKHPLSLIRADVDTFKTINDTYGHKAGNMAMQGLAYVIKENIRQADTAFRFGDRSDEFGIILRETELTEARKIAERIRDGAFAKKYEHKGRTFGPVTLTQGIDVYLPKDDVSADYKAIALELDENADYAAIEAKKASRRNSINIYAHESGGLLS